ncbi:BZ3500_MvSof-1268-A1-R1_Chr8-1g09985 [Microbotryum saponariae]|uniref:BZ3500_MvSof-1268-A1-R1_Chr8-1g09985 protein n=1 Tax=Microbotryum saponariae TaxID=289078 RepID=A0A2X0KQF3_9BASI|nr:BZ3500_MvSof-1268-A1-R1_Chr8-1g09985 [Microbotryum saponariae]SDA08271.1 BZ3501_MvSof-1269-A2-R1_Chr8-1g09708 [Microbotryum saponariae]
MLRCAGARSIALLLVGLATKSVLGAVTPTAPGPGVTFDVGGQCSFTWTADTTNTWTSFDVDLMSGSNQAMSVVTRVTSGLDGTKSGTATFTCPDVTPNSAIYFFQFTMSDADPQWTTRFTIASSTGATTTPAHSTQSDGSAIPWGVGTLAGGAAANSSLTATRRTSSTRTLSSSTVSSTTTTVTTTVPASPTTTAVSGTITTSSSTPDSTSDTALPSSSYSSSSSSASTSASATATAAAATGGAFFSTWPMGGKIGFFVGIGVAGLIVVALLIWLGIHLCRRREDDGPENFVNEWDTVDQDPYYANQNQSTVHAGAAAAHDEDAGYASEKVYGRSQVDDLYAATSRIPGGGHEAYPLVSRGGEAAYNHSTADFAAYPHNDYPQRAVSPSNYGGAADESFPHGYQDTTNQPQHRW